jgi:MTH538 TIR-like domain (DUF1863)
MTATRPPAPLPSQALAPPADARDDFAYDAFISYSGFRKPGGGSEFDMKVAERLHRSLEAYRVPRSLLKKSPGRQGIPRRLRKVFRDRNEVRAGGSLDESLTEALRRSRFLIVVCSPRARRSQWIGREIAIFRGLGRGGQILPLLIEGEPAESFPDGLFEPGPAGAGAAGRLLAQPLAADIRAPSVAKSLRLLKEEKLRLLAPILGCDYDDLRRREHERFVRRATGAGAAMLTLLLVLTYLSLSLFFEQRRADRNRRLALSAGSQLLPILGLNPDAPFGINDPSVREAALDHAIADMERVREDDPGNLDCLLILRALYGTRAGLLREGNRADESLEAYRKAESMVIPIALSRLRAWEPTEPAGVRELSGDSIAFPNDYDLRRLRNLLNVMGQSGGAASVKDALDYVDAVAEYVPLLDTSAGEGRDEARRVLRASLDRFQQARSVHPPTDEEEELVGVIQKTLNKLPPDD